MGWMVPSVIMIRSGYDASASPPSLFHPDAVCYTRLNCELTSAEAIVVVDACTRAIVAHVVHNGAVGGQGLGKA